MPLLTLRNVHGMDGAPASLSARYNAQGEQHTATLTLGSQTTWTVSCWGRLAVDRNFWSAFWQLGPLQFMVDEDGTTLIIWDSAAATARLFAAPPTLVIGTWYHFVLSVSGTAATLRYRTEAAGSYTTTTTTVAASHTLTDLRIGGNSVSTEWLDGNVAAFKLWIGAALNASEATAEGVQYDAVRTANLSRAYRLSGSATEQTGTGPDLSGGPGATWETGPGIPLVSAANANAGDATHTLSVETATVWVTPDIGDAQATVAALDASASTTTTTNAAAETATLGVAVDGGVTTVQVGADAATFTEDGQPGGAAVGSAAVAADLSLTGSVSSSSLSLRPAEALVDAQGLGVVGAVVGNAQLAALELAGENAASSSSAAAETATAGVAADDAAASTSGNTVAQADLAALGVAATAPGGTAVTGAGLGGVGIGVDDPVGVVGAGAADGVFGVATEGATSNVATRSVGAVVGVEAGTGSASIDLTAESAVLSAAAQNAAGSSLTSVDANAQAATLGVTASDGTASAMAAGEVAELVATGWGPGWGAAGAALAALLSASGEDSVAAFSREAVAGLAEAGFGSDDSAPQVAPGPVSALLSVVATLPVVEVPALVGLMVTLMRSAPAIQMLHRPGNVASFAVSTEAMIPMERSAAIMTPTSRE